MLGLHRLQDQGVHNGHELQVSVPAQQSDSRLRSTAGRVGPRPAPPEDVAQALRRTVLHDPLAHRDVAAEWMLVQPEAHVGAS